FSSASGVATERFAYTSAAPATAAFCRELFHPRKGMYLHDFDGRLRNLQMRMTLERFSCRFMRICFHDRVQHDVVFSIRYALDSNELGLAYPGPYISEHICMIVHPFLP